MISTALLRETSHCPLCGAEEGVPILDAPDYFIARGRSERFQVLLCEGCATAFTAPPMTDEELRDYYPDEYESYTPKGGLHQLLLTVKYATDIARFKRIGIKPGAEVFEIGAGRGEFLHALKRRGYRAGGLEPSSAARKLAKETWDIDLMGGFAGNLAFEKRYDLIMARHVLEHIDAAGSVLERVYRDGLKPGGVLFLKLPRLDSWEARYFGEYWHGYDLPRHRLHFTREGIVRLLGAVGFIGITVKPEAVPLDILRSSANLARHGSAREQRMLPRLIARFPFPLAVLLSQTWALTRAQAAGRMIVVARKPR